MKTVKFQRRHNPRQCYNVVLSNGTEHFKTFLQWTLDRYPNVRAKGGLDNYWRALKLYTYDRCGRELSDVLTKDVTNVKAHDL